MFGTGRRKNESILEGLAPVVAGTVDRDGHLRGTVAGRAVEVWLQRIDPAPQTEASILDFKPTYVDVIHIRLEATGKSLWYVRAEGLAHLGGGYHYEFIAQVAPTLFRRFSPLHDLIPVEDPATDERLEQAGLFEAITRLSPPAGLWLPRVEFAPDPRPAVRERMANVPIPASARNQPEDPSPHIGLMIDVPRDGDSDPTPQRFAEMLDALIGIAELNERVNPA